MTPPLARRTTDADGRVYDFTISVDADDAKWDDFLSGVAGGHHVQTSLWARVKRSGGWRAARIVVNDANGIVGGGQMLFRAVGPFGAVAYVPKGPVLSVDDGSLRGALIDALMALAADYKVRHLTIQPANNGRTFTVPLLARGFRGSLVPVAPAASLIVDLSPSVETLMAQMTRSTRYNVRLAERKGVAVREGGEGDLETYHTMLAATGARQNFGVYSLEHFTDMWKWLHPGGHLKLFLAEVQGEVVSGQLIVPFGDTVINKLAVWSGHHGPSRPNELLQWHAIQWSRANGYAYYDFEGIDRAAAEALQRNQPIPDSVKRTVTSFKLGFGGEPALFPEAFYRVKSAILGYGYERVFPKLQESSVMKMAMSRLRVGRR